MRQRVATGRQWGWVVLVLLLGLALAAAVLGPRWLARHGAGWTHDPEDAPWVLPRAAHKQVEQAFAGMDGQPIVDRGVGVISRGQLSGPGFANHSRERGRNVAAIGGWLSRRLRDRAAGIVAPATADADYVSRLVRQIRAMPGAYRAEISARDGAFDAHGRPLTDLPLPVVSNRYVDWLADERAPDALRSEVSIQPRRPDAAAALKRWAAAGVHDVRWWPAAQHIDLDGQAAKAMYRLMAAHDMRLDVAIGRLSPIGHDPVWIAPAAVEAALDAGVAVRLRLGDTQGDQGQQLMPGLFALLHRHADEHAKLTISLAGLLRGDRPKTELEPLLQHPQYFDHLRYASGYPGIARADAIDLDALAAAGFISSDDASALRAIYDVNPLLFALVVMRHVHLPYTSLRLPATVFTAADGDD